MLPAGRNPKLSKYFSESESEIYNCNWIYLGYYDLRKLTLAQPKEFIPGIDEWIRKILFRAISDLARPTGKPNSQHRRRILLAWLFIEALFRKKKGTQVGDVGMPPNDPAECIGSNLLNGIHSWLNVQRCRKLANFVQ